MADPQDIKPNPLFKLGSYLRKGETGKEGQQIFLKGDKNLQRKNF